MFILGTDSLACLLTDRYLQYFPPIIVKFMPRKFELKYTCELGHDLLARSNICTDFRALKITVLSKNYSAVFHGSVENHAKETGKGSVYFLQTCSI